MAPSSVALAPLPQSPVDRSTSGPSNHEELAPIALRRVPSLETIGVRSSWWGYSEMSPDHNAIVGAADLPSGLFFATGFSGHGFQQAPVIGEHLAELALGFETTFDLEPLSLTRFAEGRERVEHNLV